jgi:hypothetical protein
MRTSWPRVLIATLSGLLAFVLLVGGGALLWAELALRDADGFYTSRQVALRGDGHALVVDDLRLDNLGVGVLQQSGGQALRGQLTLRVTARDADGGPIFVGVAPQQQVAEYLRGVAQDQVRDLEFTSAPVDTVAVPGTAVPALPAAQPFWVASEQGTGPQTLTWPAQEGRWAFVVMNPDGAAGVAVLTAAGASIDFLTPIAIGLLVLGALCLLVTIAAVMARSGREGVAERAVERSGAYPLRLGGEPDPAPSRWLWLVKWLLAFPHLIALAFLWVAFVLMTVVAWFAILFTGRYPRPLFDFNTGVLRWTWRIGYYAYNALGTDRYPPFTLAPTDHPATLEIAYPQRLSRPLVLVKWLLAVPHLLIVAVLVGSAGNLGLNRWWPVPPLVGGGLIGLLVLVVAGHLVLVGRYPRDLHNLVVGLNRWLFRVVIYVALMTDEYPPFRLDLTEPDGVSPERQPEPGLVQESSPS